MQWGYVSDILVWGNHENVAVNVCANQGCENIFKESLDEDLPVLYRKFAGKSSLALGQAFDWNDCYVAGHDSVSASLKVSSANFILASRESITVFVVTTLMPRLTIFELTDLSTSSIT